MNKTILILLTLLCFSCGDKEKTEKKFITNKNQFWGYEDFCANNGIVYFQFNKNGKYDKFLRSDVGFDLFNNDGDLVDEFRTWYIKDDSTFVFNKWIYKIEKISENEILLSYYHYKIKNKKCYVRLSKWLNTPKGPKLLDQPDNIKN